MIVFKPCTLDIPVNWSVILGLPSIPMTSLLDTDKNSLMNSSTEDMLYSSSILVSRWFNNVKSSSGLLGVGVPLNKNTLFPLLRSLMYWLKNLKLYDRWLPMVTPVTTSLPVASCTVFVVRDTLAPRLPLEFSAAMPMFL